MSNSDIVSSVSKPGDYYYDPVNDRFRGMVPQFVSNPERLQEDWRTFVNQADSDPHQASRLTLRAVTTPETAAQADRQLTEAYIPVTAGAGLLYLAMNTPGRQPQLPVDVMNKTVDTVASDIQHRFRPPAGRLPELRARGYSFTDRVTDPEGQRALWGPTFGWNAENIQNLETRLAANARRDPADRDIWFTGVLSDGHVVAAALAERLDVPGPNGKLPTIESTEWVVDPSRRHAGLACGMLALNAAQCLQDLPNARILAECRFSTTAYAAGMSIGFAVPALGSTPQILARNVWVDGELADFVPISLPDEAVREHYSPTARAEMLSYLNQ